MHTQITNSITLAADFLKAGEVVAFPTETVFGLGAVIDKPEAIQKIYKLKGRPQDNPLIVHICDFAELEGLAEAVPQEALNLMEELWPGPITFVLRKNPLVGDYVTAGLPTVAIRMPAHPMARELIKQVGVSVAAPSANLSGKPSATKTSHVLNDFDGKLVCVLEGETQVGLESTVLDCTEKPFRILRGGSITQEELLRLLPEGWLSVSVGINSSDESFGEVLQEAPKSPGMKYKHYAPKAKVILIKDFSVVGPEINLGKTAYIGLIQPSLVFAKQICCQDMSEYGQRVFAFFRDCDEAGIEIIYCQLPKAEGLGRALRERLNKAAAADGLG